MYRHREHFSEAKDGITYLWLSFEEPISSVLLTWFGEPENKKWFHKIRRNLKRFKAKPEDDFESEFIDIDILLDLFIEEYVAKKKQNLKDLQKEFMRAYAGRKDGTFSTDEMDKIMQTSIPMLSTSAFVKYPGSFTMRRAFLYALICKDNNNYVNPVEFLAGCNRFGLDSPAPTIHKRISLYGNEEDFEDIIKKQLELYNLHQQALMHTSKVA